MKIMIILFLSLNLGFASQIQGPVTPDAGSEDISIMG